MIYKSLYSGEPSIIVGDMLFSVLKVLLLKVPLSLLHTMSTLLVIPLAVIALHVSVSGWPTLWVLGAVTVTLGVGTTTLRVNKFQIHVWLTSKCLQYNWCWSTSFQYHHITHVCTLISFHQVHKLDIASVSVTTKSGWVDGYSTIICNSVSSTSHPTDHYWTGFHSTNCTHCTLDHLWTTHHSSLYGTRWGYGDSRMRNCKENLYKFRIRFAYLNHNKPYYTYSAWFTYWNRAWWQCRSNWLITISSLYYSISVCSNMFMCVHGLVMFQLSQYGFLVWSMWWLVRL